MAAGPDRLRRARRGRRGLQPCQRRRDHHPRARRADQRADRQPHADRAHARARLGPLRAALRVDREGARASSASRPGRRCGKASSARSSGRARTSTGSSAASRGTRSRCRSSAAFPPEGRGWPGSDVADSMDTRRADRATRTLVIRPVTGWSLPELPGAVRIARPRLLPGPARRDRPLQAVGRSARCGRSCSRSCSAAVFSVFLGAVANVSSGDGSPTPSSRCPGW